MLAGAFSKDPKGCMYGISTTGAVLLYSNSSMHYRTEVKYTAVCVVDAVRYRRTSVTIQSLQKNACSAITRVVFPSPIIISTTGRRRGGGGKLVVFWQDLADQASHFRENSKD